MIDSIAGNGPVSSVVWQEVFMENLQGKVAFVTGAASGLGLVMARSLYRAGMHLVLTDIEQSALDTVRPEFEGMGDVITRQLDVMDRDDMESAARAAEQAFGKVHVVCNNAGVAFSGSTETLGYSDWDWVLGVNLQGVINGVVTFVNRMLSHGEGGHFVNTSSMAGLVPVPGLAIYNTSKYALVGMSEAMHLDLAHLNIGVSVLCPGVVSTNLPNSQRNRPVSLATDNKVVATTGNPVSDSRTKRLQELMGIVIEPEIVGDMVRHAIETNELYILTHPELQEMVELRMDSIRQASSKWESFIRDWKVNPTSG
jgi:NAD(P)-dependent dehydrogenase (short-subunit alcohol dehydrogenase family)